MPERFRRSRTRYENNERIYVGEVRQKEKERERLIQQQAKRGKDLVFALLTIIDHCAAFLFS